MGFLRPLPSLASLRTDTPPGNHFHPAWLAFLFYVAWGTGCAEVTQTLQRRCTGEMTLGLGVPLLYLYYLLNTNYFHPTLMVGVISCIDSHVRLLTDVLVTNFPLPKPSYLL